MSDLPTLVTAKQLAPMIGVAGPKKVSEWKQAGKIPAAVDEPGFVRYDPEQVLEHLKARAKKAAKKRGVRTN